MRQRFNHRRRMEYRVDVFARGLNVRVIANVALKPAHTILALWLAEAGWWFWDAYPRWRVVLVVSVTVVFWGAFLYAVLRGRRLRRAAEPETETR